MDSKRDPQRLSLASYPVSHSIAARFSDMDVNRHLNNVALASYYEDARVSVHLRMFAEDPPTGVHRFSLVVAQVSIHYLAEAPFPGVYVIGGGIGRIGRSSFTHYAGLFLDGVCLGVSDTVVVHMVDGVPTAIPPYRRAQLEALAFPSRPTAAPDGPAADGPAADGAAATIPGQPSQSRRAAGADRP
jgi:acyl-CoA thioester hydrolase